MSVFDTIVWFAYLAAATAFVLGLHLMNSPATARRGNRVSAAGMVLAVLTTFVLIGHERLIDGLGWTVLGVGTAVGAMLGPHLARPCG